jgi:hypothetical protein
MACRRHQDDSTRQDVNAPGHPKKDKNITLVVLVLKSALLYVSKKNTNVLSTMQQPEKGSARRNICHNFFLSVLPNPWNSVLPI